MTEHFISKIGIKKFSDKQIENDNSKKNFAGSVHLPSFTRAYENICTALNTVNAPLQKFDTVLYVICVHNFRPYTGFRLNNEKYSAHAQDGEIVFTEGLKVMVLGHEKVYSKNIQKSIKSKGYFWPEFQPKALNVIYLFHG